MTIAERGALTPEEVAAYLHLSRSKVYSLLGAGVIPSWKIGKSRRVSVEQLQGWIREQETAEVSAA